MSFSGAVSLAVVTDVDIEDRHFYKTSVAPD